MPRPIKYSTSTQSRAIMKGNFHLGTGDNGKGPTSLNDWFNSFDPPDGGYCVYSNPSSNGMEIRVASNDSELITITNRHFSQNFTTVNECFNYYLGQDDKMVMGLGGEEIVSDGLIIDFNASVLASYPRNGSSWRDLSTEQTNGSLINGLTFGSDSVFDGYLNFDGGDNYVQVNSWNNQSTVNTVEMWARWRAGSSDMFMGFTTYDIWTSGGHLGFNTGQGDVYGISSTQVSNLGLVGTGTNNWHHYIFQFTNQVQNNKIYIDSVEQTLSQQTGTTNLTAGRSFASSFQIGSWNNSNGYFFNGDVAIFRIYNRALTQDEINLNYSRIEL